MLYVFRHGAVKAALVARFAAALVHGGDLVAGVLGDSTTAGADNCIYDAWPYGLERQVGCPWAAGSSAPGAPLPSPLSMHACCFHDSPAGAGGPPTSVYHPTTALLVRPETDSTDRGGHPTFAAGAVVRGGQGKL